MEYFLPVLTLLAASHPSFAPDSCDPTEWKCLDGTCIPIEERCDNVPDDCPDNSDETYCNSEIACPEGQNRCFDINGNATCKTVCECVPTLEIPHGNITANDTIEGSEGTVSCEEGYIPNNSHVICQKNGTWSEAVCNVTVCGQLPFLSNGILNLTDPSNFTFGATAKVKCFIGFEPSTSVVVCLSSGYWGTATCTLVDCGKAPEIPNGDSTLDTPANTSYGSVAEVVCDEGYTANVSTIKCLSSGVWEVAFCKIVGTDGGKDDNTTAIIIGVILGVFSLVQLIAIGVHFWLRRNYNLDKSEIVLLAVLSAIPVIGIAVVAYRFSGAKFGTYLVEKMRLHFHRTERHNAASTNSGITNGQSTVQTSDDNYDVIGTIQTTSDHRYDNSGLAQNSDNGYTNIGTVQTSDHNYDNTGEVQPSEHSYENS